MNAAQFSVDNILIVVIVKVLGIYLSRLLSIPKVANRQSLHTPELVILAVVNIQNKGKKKNEDCEEVKKKGPGESIKHTRLDD